MINCTNAIYLKPMEIIYLKSYVDERVKLEKSKPGKVYSVPEYTEFPHAFFAERTLKYQLRLAPRNRFFKNINSLN
jgi:hypothetical protein